ncbi:hypothetical protein [Umezawaea tangerina]|uniref:Uncharacterized protein n=1 Tax=Umezawaea tangerina TaxID=84725 RepID=A0A2T0SPN0_9PSEU|nr:hypothetical protein [Umezawaea tangerina]PRY35365.1 hypothetical protein CLV43_114283 [Umezawaea tangerina]
MSSAFDLVCLSHDPGISVRMITDSAEVRTLDGAHEWMRSRTQHEACDVVIVRVSGGPVEVICPPSGCSAHSNSVVRVDVPWLRLLWAAQQCDKNTPAGRAAEQAASCWSTTRLHRLRHELDVVRLESP